jgi:hypothetical protein
MRQVRDKMNVCSTQEVRIDRGAHQFSTCVCISLQSRDQRERSVAICDAGVSRDCLGWLHSERPGTLAGFRPHQACRTDQIPRRSDVVAIADYNSDSPVGKWSRYRGGLLLQPMQIDVRINRVLRGHLASGAKNSVYYLLYVGSSGGGSIGKRPPSGSGIYLMRREKGCLRLSADLYPYTCVVPLPEWVDRNLGVMVM